MSAFDIACNQCLPCFRHDYSCCDTTNPSKEQELLYGDRYIWTSPILNFLLLRKCIEVLFSEYILICIWT